VTGREDEGTSGGPWPLARARVAGELASHHVTRRGLAADSRHGTCGGAGTCGRHVHADTPSPIREEHAGVAARGPGRTTMLPAQRCAGARPIPSRCHRRRLSCEPRARCGVRRAPGADGSLWSAS
jgi:hypothetical protein